MNFQDQVGNPLPFPEHLNDTLVPASTVNATPVGFPLILMKSTSMPLTALIAFDRSALDTNIAAKK